MSGITTIPAGVPFLSALARGLLARHHSADDPFALSRVTVYLPTRRAVRALEEAFLDSLGAKPSAALLLPRFKGLGEADEDELALAANEDGDAEIPSAVSQSQRLVHLGALLKPLTQDLESALAWAGSLARFLDEVLIEEADLGAIEKALPRELTEQFEGSRQFLRILKEEWPNILAEDGVIERAERRRRLMDAQIAAWAKSPPGPVYVAGSVGTVPATQRLMKAVIALPEGGIVLPGLDRVLDAESWEAIDDSHPQSGLKLLLERLGVRVRA